MSVYVINDQGEREEINWFDFMTNDDNPALVRMADKLAETPEWQEIVKQVNKD